MSAGPRREQPAEGGVAHRLAQRIDRHRAALIDGVAEEPEQRKKKKYKKNRINIFQ